MKHYAHKIYFFKNGQMIVLYKLYFFKTYYVVYDDYLKMDSDFKLDASRFVDFTYMSDLQTEQFFKTLNKSNLRSIPHFYDKD